jgi:hypothetical protein
MNLASVSTISYADSNDGIFVLVGSLGCIKPKIVGPECPRLSNSILGKRCELRSICFGTKSTNSSRKTPTCYGSGAKLGTDTAILQQGTCSFAAAAS